MAQKSAGAMRYPWFESRSSNPRGCAYTTVLLSQSAIPDTRHYTAMGFIYHFLTHFAKMACNSESSVSALPELELSELELANTHTCKAKKEQIVIVIPSSLPPGSTPPPHPHPGNVITIISTPAKDVR